MFAEQEYGRGIVGVRKPQHAYSAPALQTTRMKTATAGLNFGRDCVLPPDASHRQFRFRLPDRSFKKMDKKISNSEELKGQLNKYDPVDVYVGVSCWLNPELVGAKRSQKAGWKHLRLCLLKSDYFMDFDAKDYINGLTGAFRVMIGAWEILKENYSDFTFVRTGKGFQLWCHSWYDSLPKKIERIQDRIEYVKQMKKKLTYKLADNLAAKYADELAKKNFPFDMPQSTNIFQIGRVWGSVHRNGTIVECAKNPFTKKLLKPEVLM